MILGYKDIGIRKSEFVAKTQLIQEKKVIEMTIEKGCPSDFKKIYYGEVKQHFSYTMGTKDLWNRNTTMR